MTQIFYTCQICKYLWAYILLQSMKLQTLERQNNEKKNKEKEDWNPCPSFINCLNKLINYIKSGYCLFKNNYYALKF